MRTIQQGRVRLIPGFGVLYLNERGIYPHETSRNRDGYPERFTGSWYAFVLNRRQW